MLYSPGCISSWHQRQLFKFINYINVFLSLNVSLSVSLFPFVDVRFDLVCHTVYPSLSRTHKPHMLSCAHLTSCIFAILYNHTQKYLLVWSKMVHVIHTVYSTFQLNFTIVFLFFVSSYIFRPMPFVSKFNAFRLFSIVFNVCLFSSYLL